MTDELDFAHATFKRALDGTCRLTPIGSAPLQTRLQDEALAETFAVHCTAFRREWPDGDPGVLRETALQAYTVLRQRHELRKPPEAPGPLELLPFDEEDRRLAGI